MKRIELNRRQIGRWVEIITSGVNNELKKKIT